MPLSHMNGMRYSSFSSSLSSRHRVNIVVSVFFFLFDRKTTCFHSKIMNKHQRREERTRE